MTSETPAGNVMWRNNGDGTFTNVTEAVGLAGTCATAGSIATDSNNDRAVDLVTVGGKAPTIFENPREGKFKPLNPWTAAMPSLTFGATVFDFNHDGWMDLALTHSGETSLTLWRNKHGKLEF